MYADLLSAIKQLLLDTSAFKSVVCGVGAPDGGYPAANLWLQKGTEVGGKNDTLEDEQILVQVQYYPDDDKEQSYLDLVDLLATAKKAINRARLPGHGAQQVSVPDFEAMRLPDNGAMVYVLKVGVRVNPSSFTTT